MALMAALARWGHIPGGLSNRTLRQHVAMLLSDPAYSSAHMSYDLRRLRLKGVIQRLPQSQTYVLTEFGIKVTQFLTKLYTRLFRPGLTALVPDQPLPGALAEALTTVSDLINALVTEAQLGEPIMP